MLVVPPCVVVVVVMASVVVGENVTEVDVKLTNDVVCVCGVVVPVVSEGVSVVVTIDEVVTVVGDCFGQTRSGNTASA